MKRPLSLILFVIIALSLFPACADSDNNSEFEPLAWAFYYPWYRMPDWESPILVSETETLDRPATLYVSSNADDIARQISQARDAGIDGFLSSWWGPGWDSESSYSDTNLGILLDEAKSQNLKVAAYFETISGETLEAHPKDQLIEWLAYLLETRATHPAYTKVNGKPLVVFWDSNEVDLDTWGAIFQELEAQGLEGFYISMGCDETDQLSIFDGLHDYRIMTYGDPILDLTHAGEITKNYHLQHDADPKIWAATVYPGYDDHRIPGRGGKVIPRLEGATYRESWRNAVSTTPDWIFIVSWNEWWEQTHIEPSIFYRSEYLEITKQESAIWKASH